MAKLLPATGDGIAEAARLLAHGGLVAFPTETVYGLGADATNPHAVRRIFAAKGRPSHNPLIVHVSDAAAARRWSTTWPPHAARLATAFWPGPLTLVLPAAPGIAPDVLAGGTTIGLRSPDHPAAQALLRACQLPIAAPSANPSGLLSPVEARHVLADLGHALDAVLDGGACRVGIESTVVDCTGEQIRILRPGGVSQAALEQTLDAAVPSRRNSADPPSGPLRSPGQLARHYAPRIPLRVVARHQLDAAAPTVARVYLGPPDPARKPGAHERILPADPAACAARLYATLREMQDTGAAEVWIESVPDSSEWAAVADRLRRAAAGG